MNIKLSGILLSALFILVAAACETNNGKKTLPAHRPVPAGPQVEIRQGHAAQFDSGNVPEDLKQAVQRNIVEYINELNNIIKRRDYDEWRKRLSAGYQKYLASPENLERAAQADRIKKNNIKLENLRDYFMHVVVPSRDHDRVDDIEFVKETQVKAYTIDRNSRRLRLYELERAGDSWIIIN